MSNHKPYDKYNFVLSVIGFIGSIGFYIGVLREIADTNPEKQLIEQLQHENRHLKEHLKCCDSRTSYLIINDKAMINRRNYYRVMRSVPLDSLPHDLRKEAEQVNSLTENGKTWEYYTTRHYDYGEPYPFKKELDSYFSKLHVFLKKNNPDALNIKGRIPKSSSAEPGSSKGNKLPQYRTDSIRKGVYFMRKFLNLDGKSLTRKQVLQSLNELQLAIITKQVILYEFRYAIDALQQELIDQLKSSNPKLKTASKFTLPPAIVSMMNGSLSKFKTYSSLTPVNLKANKDDSPVLRLVKIYIGLQGTELSYQKIQALRSEFQQVSYSFNADAENDPWNPEFRAQLRELDRLVDSNQTTIPFHFVYQDWRYAYSEAAKNKLLSLDSTGKVIKPKLDGLDGTKEADFITFLVGNLSLNEKLNRPQVEKVAFQMGIENKTVIKELTEYAIVKRAREIALGHGDVDQKYEKMVNLYNHQTNISFRTSQSILLKQYSTPAPIGYLMGVYCGIQSGTKSVFEPSAGNGLLTIAAHPKKVIVNEIDDNRRSNLLRDQYQEVLKRDASKPFGDMYQHFDAVITNPPFGRIGRNEKLYVDGYRIYDLDHHMALIALDTMRDSGKAAIIIGGHLTYDDRGRITAGKDRIFFNYLYSKYHVEDVIALDGKKLYSKQGTAFNVTLILINGRKNNQPAVAPLYDPKRDAVVRSFDELHKRVMKHLKSVPTSEHLRTKAQDIMRKLQGGTLEGPYHPSSKARSLETNVPDSMDFELHQALTQITQDVGGDMDNFVRHRLGYRTKQQLYDALGAEQIDAVGMAIYNIEALNQGIIIGDQTGIGKGRTAAAMIRYANQQGLKPIFLTVGVNLFSDIYRDLEAIGSASLVPFIVNARESKTDVKDQDGLVLYQAPTSIEQAKVFESKDLTGYDFVMATYSQFNSADKKPVKPNFLLEVAKDTIIIMDESHIASGSSKTGQLMQQVVRSTKGAVFLSATFAKRPNNMPIYAVKTAISETNMSKEALISAIERGGVALQEILSSQLVSEGQMVRRERTYEGIEVNYISLDNKAQEHSAIADNITSIIRDIIRFQNLYVDNRVSELDEMMAGEGSQASKRKGTEQGGVDNQPYFSKVFNVINQMLFAIKAEDVADRAIMRLKEGKKPIIAFSSTMGSFLEQIEDEDGIKATIGDTINADFAIVLEKGLQGVLRYTVTEPNGKKAYMTFDPAELGNMALDEYHRIRTEIRTISSGITVSPIDVIIQKIEKAGYKVGEVTGRKLRLNLNGNKGTVEIRKRFNTNDVFRRFNNNELDVLLINQSGSTGASAHAIPTSKVPADQVKQRVMIVLQPELDINIEIQKRGRINRTGQIFKPIYDYINSAIPAEKRLMMMLQKKLKSLDANTSSNQKQSSKILSVQDFLNKYGDAIVVAYLTENPQLNELLGDPIHVSTTKQLPGEESKDAVQSEDAAAKVSGRVAVLSTRMQEEFYNEISDRYENLIAYLKQTGDYDLEVEEMDLKAKTITTRVLNMGKGGNTAFGEDSILETIEANVLKKPFKTDELKSILMQTLEGKTPDSYREELLRGLDEHADQMLEDVRKKVTDHFQHQRKNAENEAKLKKIKRETPELYNDALINRLAELSDLEAKKLENETSQIKRRISQVRDYFNYFTVGKHLIYPETYGEETINSMAVFMGFKIEPKRKNPYAPSAIALRFAVASSQKSIEIPASYGMLLNAIRGASTSIVDKGIDHTLYAWGDAIYTSNKDRQIRYVVTGNILQAFASAKGKLISFTTIDGETRKGILLPESVDLEKTIGNGVSIPISKTINLFKSLVQGKQITCSHGITFFREHENMYRMIVSGSMREGGEVFLNLKVIALTFNENFEKVGTNMTAHVERSDLPEMLNVLEDDIGVSVTMTDEQIKSMGLVDRPVKKRIKIEVPPQEEPPTKQDDRVRLLRLRAKALEIELKLLESKNKAS